MLCVPEGGRITEGIVMDAVRTAEGLRNAPVQTEAQVLQDIAQDEALERRKAAAPARKPRKK